jgi:Protein of unknown function (DUF3108)
MRPVFKNMCVGAALMMAGALFSAPAQAEKIRMASEYSISFAGIPVARSKFRTLIDGDLLTVTGTLATSGLAAVFDSTKAISTSSGVLSEKGVESRSFELDYKSGKKSRNTKVSFRSGNVVDTVITPVRPENPNDVPLQPGQLRGVMDPFFASIVSAADPAQVCNRTLKVFDGVIRINLVMRPSGREPYVVGNVQGNGVRCAVRYEPVAGHRATSSSVRFMSEGERATIVFGTLAGTNLYAPVKAAIKTKNGTVTIRATKFEQTVE